MVAGLQDRPLPRQLHLGHIKMAAVLVKSDYVSVSQSYALRIMDVETLQAPGLLTPLPLGAQGELLTGPFAPVKDPAVPTAARVLRMETLHQGRDPV